MIDADTPAGTSFPSRIDVRPGPNEHLGRHVSVAWKA